MDRRDPVGAHDREDLDLYDVATWEPRTALDRLSVRVFESLQLLARSVYRSVIAITRALVLTLALLILLSQFVLGGIGAVFVEDPAAVALVLLSVIPALLLAGYVYFSDITTSEPLGLLVGTVVLSILFASFAAVVNTLLEPFFQVPGVLGILGLVAFFYLVVGPAEEVVKWLAVRLFAYRDRRFNAVIDGAVYGAAAGFGFATIENSLFIALELSGADETVGVGMGLLGAGVAQFGAERLGGITTTGGQITALRALAGPGHVLYSAFAGYYLGLAKFNPSRAGPIAIKGLLIAAFIHGTYNVLVTIVPPIVTALAPGTNELALFFGIVVVYDGLFGYILVRKLRKYRRAYATIHDREAREDREAAAGLPDKTEFDA